MWQTRKRKSEVRRDLIEVLERTKTLIDDSDESCWAGRSPAEIAMDLSISIEKLTNGDSVDDSVKPTGRTDS
jgi:hypothetical protein